MDVDISGLSLHAPTAATYVPQEDFRFMVCPICQSEADSFLLADVRCNGMTSIESAFCRACEHRYLRKLPTREWFQQYYSNVWDTSRTRAPSNPTSFASGVKSSIKQIPLARSAWRALQPQSRDAALRGRESYLFPFLFGVGESDGFYYQPQPDVKKVLEIGCGYGGTLEMFQRRGFTAVGTEASAVRAQSCRAQGLNVFDCPDGDLSPVESLAPFDLAYSIQVLEHIDDPNTHIRSLTSLLRDGGYLYIQVPHATNGEMLIHHSHTPVHCHSYSPRSLALLLQANGMVPLRVLVDHNVHLLATKRPASSASPVAYSGSVNPDQLLECFQAVTGEAGKPLRASWDHAYLQIDRVEDGTVLYDKRNDLNVAPMSFRHSMEFSVSDDPAGASFPVHFNYTGDAPPIWIKLN